MEEFLEEAFRVERDLVRLSYWIGALDWTHYRVETQHQAEEAERRSGRLIGDLRSLRFQIREQKE